MYGIWSFIWNQHTENKDKWFINWIINEWWRKRMKIYLFCKSIHILNMWIVDAFFEIQKKHSKYVKCLNFKNILLSYI